MLEMLADETNDRRNVKEESLTEAEVDARDQEESTLTDLAAAQASMTRLRKHMNSFVVLNMFPQMMYKLTCMNRECQYVVRKIGHQPELSLTVDQNTPMVESLENLIGHDYGPSTREKVEATCAKCTDEGRETKYRRLERYLCYLPEYIQITLWSDCKTL
jgi:hypothetical protein